LSDKDKKTSVTRTPGQTRQGDVARSSSSEIADFVQHVGAMKSERAGGRGRLLFALDATMSRQPTWDLACQLQAQMFDTVAQTGGLDVQLQFFRGFGESGASKWVSDAKSLARIMTGLECRGGQTQIAKVFAHARKEHKKKKVNAVVFVGDAMEEDIDRLAHRAGELGLLNCPMFLFQEGNDARVEKAFREFARLTKGAYARFDSSAPDQLAELLRAVAAFASGGRTALQSQNSGSARLLLEQMK